MEIKTRCNTTRGCADKSQKVNNNHNNIPGNAAHRVYNTSDASKDDDDEDNGDDNSDDGRR